MKLFDDAGDDDLEKISKIEVNKEFAKRYEHNKKREDLHRLQEMKKKGLVDDSGSDSESDPESESDDDDAGDVTKEVKFFDALLKVRKKDPILKDKDAKLFDDDDDDGGGERKEEKRKRKREKEKPMYLKDVMAKHLIEEGPDFNGENEDNEVKTYADEQEELRKSVLDAMAKAERETDLENGGDFLKPREVDEDDEEYDDDHNDEMKQRLDEFFGDDEKLDENDMFLKDFFKNQLWKDKEKGKKVANAEFEAFSDDEEALERQEDYEREYNFRFEENAGDRVLGHSRVVSGSVRKESNARKQQRERKKEREAKAEVERREEVKRLKNVKKREIHEKLEKIREIAGVGEGGIGVITEDDLEEDFEPEEFDRKMKAAFGDEYYQAQDANPEFGSDNDNDDDDLKPDFDKEDELLGLPKDWDVIKSNDGFLAEREKRLKIDSENDNDDVGGGGKRKRKRKLSLKEKVEVEKELEELYKLDYEGAIGDLKTRFKYREVAPRKFGLSAAEVLVLDDKELNQFVPLKKIVPYREKEWKVNPMQKSMFMKKKRELLEGRLRNGETSGKRRNRMDGGETSKDKDEGNGGVEGGEGSNYGSKLSRSARRRRRQKDRKLPQSRLVAYGKIPASSISNSKN